VQGDFRIRVETLLAAARAKGVEVVFQTDEINLPQQNLESLQSNLGSKV
jgi:hypothetical protein